MSNILKPETIQMSIYRWIDKQIKWNTTQQKKKIE